MPVTRGEVWWGPGTAQAESGLSAVARRKRFVPPVCRRGVYRRCDDNPDHPDGIAVPDEVRGGPEKDTYVSPWYVTTIKQRDLDDQQGELTDSLLTDAVDALRGYIPRES